MRSQESSRQQLEEHLQAQANNIDHATQQRLDDMRAEAVAVAEAQLDRAFNGRAWVRYAGYAAALVMTVTTGFLVIGNQTDAGINDESPLELVLLNEDFDLLNEDLAFYSWAAEELAKSG